MQTGLQRGDLWSIILAGGEGERLRNFVEGWLGQHCPKQYCTFVGTRSMFQHTLDRADLLTPPDRRVTVISRSHRPEVLEQVRNRHAGELIAQPANRDTAPGIFLPLTHVRARAPEATVIVYPSDHFIHPEDRFAGVVEAALRAVDLMPQDLILPAVAPDRIEPQYGWIEPGTRLGCLGAHRFHKVQRFVEKPNASEARQILRNRGLWNTLILAAKVETLWAPGWECFSRMMRLFERYAATIGTSREKETREAIYAEMPSQNFSSDLLQQGILVNLLRPATAEIIRIYPAGE